MYNCVIIDDELYALAALKKYIENCPELNLLAAYSSPILALRALQDSEPLDLILMDIDMPDINGIELSKLLRPKTNKLVFTTGHTKYAYEAFKLKADDYLLKPYTLAEFMSSIHKLFPAAEPKCLTPALNTTFLVKSKEDNLRMLNVRYADVVAVESKMNYIMIHTKMRKIITYLTLLEISKILSRYPGFLQFQRSFIIAEEHIDSITGNSIRMITGLEMTVGDYYRKDFALFVSEKLIRTKRR